MRKLTLVIALLIGTAVAIRFGYYPYRCNIQLKRLDLSMRYVTHRRGSPTAVDVARQVNDALRQLPECCRSNPTYLMNLGTALLVLRRPQEAIDVYKELLKSQQRPEVYFALAHAELEAGLPTEALTHFERAVRFDPFFISSVPGGPIREEIERRVFASPER